MICFIYLTVHQYQNQTTTTITTPMIVIFETCKVLRRIRKHMCFTTNCCKNTTTSMVSSSSNNNADNERWHTFCGTNSTGKAMAKEECKVLNCSGQKDTANPPSRNPNAACASQTCWWCWRSYSDFTAKLGGCVDHTIEKTSTKLCGLKTCGCW